MRVSKIEECTEENPYTDERHEKAQEAGVRVRWSHSRAGEVGEQTNGWPGGDLVTMKCVNCGVTWRTELPQ